MILKNLNSQLITLENYIAAPTNQTHLRWTQHVRLRQNSNLRTNVY